jgi:hypothetical protein
MKNVLHRDLNAMVTYIWVELHSNGQLFIRFEKRLERTQSLHPMRSQRRLLRHVEMSNILETIVQVYACAKTWCL